MTETDPWERPSAELVQLAAAHGVASDYWSFFGEHVEVSARTLRAILAGMGVAAGSDDATSRSLAAAWDAPWRELLPPSLVVREGGSEFSVFVAVGRRVELAVELEDGTRRDLPAPAEPQEQRRVGDDLVERWSVRLPGDLPLGWHRLLAVERDGEQRETRASECVLAVTPARLETLSALLRDRWRGWGLMAQLYSVRSHGSWGIGDFADLRDLATIVGARGADFLLINPIHAAEVTTPIEPSPYLPATRRFTAPLYIRPDDIEEARRVDASQRDVLDEARRRAAAQESRIDRDATWTAKKAALELVFAVPRSAERQRSWEEFLAAEGEPLADFALWCALEEHYAGASGADVPGTDALGAVGLGVAASDASAPDADAGTGRAARPGIRSSLTDELRTRLRARIDFYLWLQWIADEQLAAAQAAALASGMRIGVMHDLAVGVHALGSDVWSMGEAYASDVFVGAPPDMYNQKGQNWHQPPWLPAALARAGYAPLRDMVRRLLRHAGAVRIDHIMGLFRLWWIPADAEADAGTYVRYDHEAMVGVLALEAQRAGAVVIGEDLGNVEPWVREYLADRGVLGTSVLWFEKDGDRPAPPEWYRESVLATVTTHDLPPTAGYLSGEHVELRDRLGQLKGPVEHEWDAHRREREATIRALVERNLVGADATEEELVVALHLYLAASPARLVGVALTDAVGEARSQNVPGTYKEYPNWQIPLADREGRNVALDDLAENARFRTLTGAVDAAMRG